MLDQARDAATQQTAAGYPLVKTIDTSFSFTREEVSVLRALAWQVAEISQRPVMAEKPAFGQRTTICRRSSHLFLSTRKMDGTR